MTYAEADVRATVALHDKLKGDWHKQPAFFIERPQGAYRTPQLRAALQRAHRRVPRGRLSL